MNKTRPYRFYKNKKAIHQAGGSLEMASGMLINFTGASDMDILEANAAALLIKVFLSIFGRSLRQCNPTADF